MSVGTGTVRACETSPARVPAAAWSAGSRPELHGSRLREELAETRRLLDRAHARAYRQRLRAERWRAKWAESRRELRALRELRLTVTALRARIVYLERQLEIARNTTAPARTSPKDTRERGQEVTV